MHDNPVKASLAAGGHRVGLTRDILDSRGEPARGAQ